MPGRWPARLISLAEPCLQFLHAGSLLCTTILIVGSLPRLPSGFVHVSENWWPLGVSKVDLHLCKHVRLHKYFSVGFACALAMTLFACTCARTCCCSRNFLLESAGLSGCLLGGLGTPSVKSLFYSTCISWPSFACLIISTSSSVSFRRSSPVSPVLV